MNKNLRIQKLAENKIDRDFYNYFTNSDKEKIIIAAFSNEQVINKIFSQKISSDSTIYKIASEYLKYSEYSENSNIMSEYAIQLPNGVVTRHVLVGLAAAVIGASMGLAGKDLHPILSPIVGAEAAILLNILSSLLLDKKSRLKQIDGLDLAVLSIFEKGNFNAEEVISRLSKNLDISEIEKSINKLLKLKLLEKGEWENTYIITKLAKSYL